MRASFSGGEGAQGGHTLIDCLRGDGRGSVQGPSARAGARREREEMQIAEGEGADEGERLLEFCVGFAGEADHYIGAQGEERASGEQEGLNFFGVVPGAVAAVHAAQHGV